MTGLLRSAPAGWSAAALAFSAALFAAYRPSGAPAQNDPSTRVEPVAEGAEINIARLAARFDLSVLPAPDAAETPALDLLADYVMVGAVEADGRFILLVRGPDGLTHALRLGDMLAGHRVASIELTEARLVRDGVERRLATPRVAPSGP